MAERNPNVHEHAGYLTPLELQSVKSILALQIQQQQDIAMRLDVVIDNVADRTGIPRDEILIDPQKGSFTRQVPTNVTPIRQDQGGDEPITEA